MKRIIEQAAKLIMYKGPAIHELIAEAVMENKEVEIDTKENITILKIKFVTAFDTNVTDIYTFNKDKELIKQEIQINKKVKVVFDKYKELDNLLRKIPSQSLAAS
ncbi:hypothetical protein [Bacillus sp. MMSF_3353]|uniref:hypothetical protein n=1 Tax=Bacillus sp. MMSF_3353 TaxID=3047081 RepID=UPI00273E9691|nr:hypothetical protein [Bacillus sp. MMSF_3353]